MLAPRPTAADADVRHDDGDLVQSGAPYGAGSHWSATWSLKAVLAVAISAVYAGIKAIF